MKGIELSTVEPLYTGTPENRKPLETEQFLTPEFLSSYLNIPL